MSTQEDSKTIEENEHITNLEKQKQEQSEQYDKLKKEFDDFKKEQFIEIESKDLEIEALKQDIINLEKSENQKNDDLECKYEQMKNENIIKQEEIERLQNELIEQKNQNEQNLQILEQLKEENLKNQEIKTQSEKYENDQNEIDQLKKEIEELNKQKESEKQTTAQQIEELQKQLAIQKEEFQKREENQANTKQNPEQNQQTKVKQKEKEKKDTVEITVKELMSWDKKVKDLQKKLKQAEKEMENQKKQNSELQIQIENANKFDKNHFNVEGLEERNKALQDIIDTQSKEIATIKSQKEKYMDQNNGLQEDLDSKERELKKLRADAKQLFELEQQISNLRENLNDANQKLQETRIIEQENESLKANIQILQQENKNHQDKLKLEQEKNENLNKQIQEINKNLQEIQNLNEEIQQKSIYLEKQSQRLQNQLQQEEKKFQEIEVQYGDLKSEKDIIQKKFTNDIKELKQLLQQEQDKTNNLSSRNSALENDVKQLREKNSRNFQSSRDIEQNQKSGLETKQEKIILESLSLRNSELEEELYKVQQKLKQIMDIQKNKDVKIHAQIHLIQELSKEIFQKNPTLQEYLDELDKEEIEQMQQHKLMDKFQLQSLMENISAKSSSKGDVLFVLYKAVLAILFAVLNDEDYQVILIFAIAVFSVSLFNIYSFNIFYHNTQVAKVITSLHVTNMWSCLMLILAYITHEYQFDAAVIIFLFGFPILIIIVFVRVEQNFQLLLMDSNNYDSLPGAIKQLQYLSKLLTLYKTDKQVSILLDGFLDYHRQLCIVDECPSKKRLMKNTKLTKQLREEKVPETLITLLAVIQGMFYLALQKFPNSTELRIYYSLYLLDKMRSKQQALQELINVEQEKPSFGQQFIVYRYKSIIELELIENDNQNNGQKIDQNENLNELSLQNHILQCRMNIERSSNLHVEFWSQLSEDIPDLGKLSEIGHQIAQINQKIDEQWNKLIKISNNIPNMMRLYAKFHTEILNDKEGGQIILRNLIELMRINKNKIGGLIDMTTEPNPTIFISAEDDSFALIQNLNQAACALLGYSKIEVLNRNVKAIMPQMYAQYHDFFLQNYLQTLEPKVLGKQRILPSKDKQEYISPLIVYVNNVPSLIHGLQFQAQLIQPKSLQQICNLIIDLENVIVNISTEAINMISLDKKKLSKKRFFITDIIQDFNDKIEAFQHRLGARAIYTEFKRKKQHFLGQIFVSPISFNVVELQGYMVKIVKLKDIDESDLERYEDNLNEVDINQQIDINQKPEIPFHIQIKLDIDVNSLDFQADDNNYYSELNDEKKGFISELVYGPPEIVSKDDVNLSFQSLIHQSQEGNQVDFTKLNMSKLQENQVNHQSNTDQQEEQQLKYGQGIKIKRYFFGKFIDIGDIREQEENILEELESLNADENQQYFNQNQHNQEGDDTKNNQNNIFRQRKAFLNFVNESEFLNVKSIKIMKYYAVCLTFIFCILCVAYHFIIDWQLNEQNERYQLISYQYQQISDGQIILQKLFQLYGVNNDYITENDKQTYFQSQITEISQALSDLETKQNFLELTNITLTSNQQKLFDDDTNSYSFNYYGLSEATQQIINRVTTVLQFDLDQFNLSNNDIQFLQYNLQNNFYEAQLQSAQYFVQQLKDWADDKTRYFQTVLIIYIVLLIFSFIGIIPIYIQVKKSQKEVLLFFLDIPNKKIKQLFQKSEQFVNQMQSGNEEELVSDQSVQIQEEEEEGLIQIRKKGKSKKHKLNQRNDQKYFMPFIQAGLVFTVYYIVAYILSSGISEKIFVLIEEYAYTTQAEPQFAFSNNALIQLLIDDQFSVVNDTPKKYVSESIRKMYTITSGIQEQHSINTNDHDNRYIEAYENVIMEDKCCDILQELAIVNQSTCKSFIDGSITEGLALALPRHIENYRKIYSQYQLATDNGDQVISLLNDDKMIEIQQMQYQYIQNLFRYLITQFQESLQTQHDTFKTMLITTLIICLILLICVYLFQWVPVLSMIQSEVLRIRYMITMIPLDICATTPSIKKLVAIYQSETYKQ
ncbi:PAS domain [Pseudocohnilembus persalinus]|uniref:PAS domain n=1 Tax=Pseudocohnilembus persalinus TaxID=266149 RepID=A0A0V0QIS3_PSEPJ|nr:PAS domain [Pseudocohnilembus persalinus]|eukprot:KRX02121.1 PAS domain [Pseudocohnilembus persalinus]